MGMIQGVSCIVALLLLALCAPCVSSWVWEEANANNVAGITKPTPTVVFAGPTATSDECRQLCGANTTCQSYDWADSYNNEGTEDATCGYVHQCFLRFDTEWHPKIAKHCNHTCGRKYTPPPSPPENAKNLLYIIVDDLRPQLSSYGMGSTVKTPNIDRLASEGTLFQHAYVQIAVCSPSRSSFLTGLYPQQQNVLNFITDFRHATKDGSSIVTVPQYFKSQGFLSTGMGKTFHPKLPANYDEPLSWSQDFAYVTAGPNGCSGKTSPWCDQGDDDPTLYADGKLVTEAIRRLSNITNNGTRRGLSNQLSRPFFMAVGLHRPHMDWIVPPMYLEKQPPVEEIELATHKTFLYPNATGWAFYNCTELTGRSRVAAMGAKIRPDIPLNDTLAKTIRREYYAAVEYMDSQVGRLLDRLDELNLTDSTAVVFHGDHGWKLGETGQWCKETVFEHDARVPLLIRAPWIEGSKGHQVSDVVELVDLFPTFADLAFNGNPTQLPTQLRGSSLVPLLNASGSFNNKTAAFSMYPRWQQYDDHGQCFKPYTDMAAIGLSIRTNRWRLTDWTVWNGTAGRPEVGTVVASELYDHSNDTGLGTDTYNNFENNNIYGLPGYEDVVKELRASISAQYGDWPSWPEPPKMRPTD